MVDPDRLAAAERHLLHCDFVAAAREVGDDRLGNRALDLYAQPQAWARVVQNGMACDFSWERAAAQYLDLYARL